MSGQNTFTPSHRLRVAAITAVFLLVVLTFNFGVSATQGCELLDGKEWVLFTILRPIFFAACHSLHLAENSIASISRWQFVWPAKPALCAFADLA